MLKNKGFKVHNRTAYWSALCSLNITEVFLLINSPTCICSVVLRYFHA